jgi:hypothetical protein
VRLVDKRADGEEPREILDVLRDCISHTRDLIADSRKLIDDYRRKWGDG